MSSPPRGLHSNMDVVLVGPVAPPRGGVSVHLDRLACLLEDEGFRVGILDHYNNVHHPLVIANLRRNPLRYWLAMRRLRAPVVHYHHSRWSTLMAAAVARGRSTEGTWIVTFHSHIIERSLTSRTPGVAALTRWAVRRFDRVIAVSAAVGDAVGPASRTRVRIIPAYLPSSNPRDGNGEPLTAPTVIVSAFRVASRSSQDVYALDFATSVFVAASKKIPDLRFEMFLTGPPRSKATKRYLAQSLEPLRAAGLERRFRLEIGSDLAQRLRRGAVYLRTTRTDGDAVSIREALDAGVPVIASDVTERPKGTITLPLRDMPAWVSAIETSLEQSQSLPEADKISNEHAEALTSLYREILGEEHSSVLCAPK